MTSGDGDDDAMRSAATGRNGDRRSAGAPVAPADRPVIPDVARDDTDLGWGDDVWSGRGERDEDWYRRERPPHWE